MHLTLESYLTQHARWPTHGRHILAQHDSESIVVYQAYNAEIGRHAVQHGTFGGAFSYERMSWIKPNFLWMMYRSGWGTKPNQEVSLAVRLRRAFFDEILEAAVPTSFDAQRYENTEAWKTALNASSIRLQWDPGHTPTGERLERRAIQLGLKGEMLKRYGQEEPLEIIDMSDFVAEQRPHATPSLYDSLVTPRETIYATANPIVASHLGLESRPPTNRPPA